MALDSWTFDGSHAQTLPIGAYTYRERPDSYTGQLGDNSTAVRVFLVDWDMQSFFIDDLLGYANVVSGGRLERVLPEEHPDYNYFYATDAAIRPVGRPGTRGVNQSVWDVAEITATYKALPYAVRADAAVATELDRFVSRTPTVKAEYLTYNNTGMKWVDGALAGQSLQFSPGVIVPGMTQVYTWTQVPAVRPEFSGDPNSEYRIPTLATALGLIGRCNSAPFDGQPAGCVLLTQVEGRMVMPKLKNGFYMWDIVYTFDMKNFGYNSPLGEYRGVNYIYSPADNQFHLVTVDGTAAGKRIYGSGDLNSLYTIPGF